MNIILSALRESVLTVEVATATLEQLADRIIADAQGQITNVKRLKVMTMTDAAIDAAIASVTVKPIDGKIVEK